MEEDKVRLMVENKVNPNRSRMTPVIPLATMLMIMIRSRQNLKKERIQKRALRKRKPKAMMIAIRRPRKSVTTSGRVHHEQHLCGTGEDPGTAATWKSTMMSIPIAATSITVKVKKIEARGLLTPQSTLTPSATTALTGLQAIGPPSQNLQKIWWTLQVKLACFKKK